MVFGSTMAAVPSSRLVAARRRPEDPIETLTNVDPGATTRVLTLAVTYLRPSVVNQL